MNVNCSVTGACPGLVWLSIIGAIISGGIIPTLYVVYDAFHRDRLKSRKRPAEQAPTSEKQAA